jgi:hypothetical protein
VPSPIRRIEVKPESDLAHLVEEMGVDREPWILVHDGREVAVLLSRGHYEELAGDHERTQRRERLLAFAGAWSDLNVDEFIERMYRDRHQSPPSEPLTL